MLDVVFVDLDGTILDVRPRYMRLLRDLLGQVPFSEREYWNLRKTGTAERDILEKHGFTGPNLEHYLADRIALIESAHYLAYDAMIEGTRDALDLFHDAGVPVVLVTYRKDRRVMLEQLISHGLRNRFTAVYSAPPEGKLEEGKVRMMREFKSDPNPRCVIIGDTEADILSGRRNSIRTIGVESGIRDRDFLSRYSPDHIAANLHEAARWLLERQATEA